jgi:two-component system NtrC family sensor kinase
LIDESSEGADRVKRIVHDLKDFARMEDGNFELVDLNDCVRSTINIVRNEIKYVADLDLKLGEIPPVNCSRHQISQVIINLLVNAAHSIRNHGSIIVSTYRENGHVVLKVSDTGHGMPEEVRKRVFDPFFTTKEVGEGTGLGLSISYSIVKKHGGEITVESCEGEGSVFTVKLPLNVSRESLV